MKYVKVLHAHLPPAGWCLPSWRYVTCVTYRHPHMWCTSSPYRPHPAQRWTRWCPLSSGLEWPEVNLGNVSTKKKMWEQHFVKSRNAWVRLNASHRAESHYPARDFLRWAFPGRETLGYTCTHTQTECIVGPRLCDSFPSAADWNTTVRALICHRPPPLFPINLSQSSPLVYLSVHLEPVCASLSHLCPAPANTYLQEQGWDPKGCREEAKCMF